MSTAVHAIASALFPPAGFTPRVQPPQPRRSSDSRHASSDQARALQTISHAIEHLVDSRLFDAWQSPSDADAVHILMVCSREVFQECSVVQSWPKRIQQGIARTLQSSASDR